MTPFGPYIDAGDGIGDCRPPMYVTWDRQRGGLQIAIYWTLKQRHPSGLYWWLPEWRAVMDDFGDLVVIGDAS